MYCEHVEVAARATEAGEDRRQLRKRHFALLRTTTGAEWYIVRYQRTSSSKGYKEEKKERVQDRACGVLWGSAARLILVIYWLPTLPDPSLIYARSPGAARAPPTEYIGIDHPRRRVSS